MHRLTQMRRLMVIEDVCVPARAFSGKVDTGFPVRKCDKTKTLGCWFEFERDAVNAMAFAGRLRSVVENMAKMSTATPAMNFCAREEEYAVLLRGNCVFADWARETRPTGFAVIFVF